MRSNCLLEAIKAKLKNPKIKIRMIPLELNKGNGIHFYWTDGEFFYHYINPEVKAKNRVWFNGQFKVYEWRFFNGIMLNRMRSVKWPLEKQAKVAAKLGMKNCSLEDLKNDPDLED